MAFRRLLRGRVPDETLAAVADAVRERHDHTAAGIEVIDADNWLSTPMVVDDRWFVKVITDQNALVHGLLTHGRNIGAFSTGNEGFFEHFASPHAMADHELAATERMCELGVNAPDPVEAFEHDGMGVLVLEYLPEFVALEELKPEAVRAHVPTVFRFLSLMHDAGLAHGDVREENLLLCEGALYFIDATRVRADAIEDATAYDLASALGALAPLVGARTVVAAAAEQYSTAELLAAEDYLDFVNIRPDHDFEAAVLKGEIEKYATE
jgi:hypothetical protein